MELAYGAIAVVLAAFIGGLFTWLGIWRTKSGNINTTEAVTLWTEGTGMREELRKDRIDLKADIVILRAQLLEAVTAVTELNREIKVSREETARARQETLQSRAETQTLMAQIDALHGEVKTFNALTMGNLADNQETRRILGIPKADRTTTEFEHLASVGERQPTGDHPPISPDELRSDLPAVEKESLNE